MIRLGGYAEPSSPACRVFDCPIQLLAIAVATVYAAKQAAPVGSADALGMASFTAFDASATGSFGPVAGVAWQPSGWTIDVASPGLACANMLREFCGRGQNASPRKR